MNFNQGMSINEQAKYVADQTAKQCAANGLLGYGGIQGMGGFPPQGSVNGQTAQYNGLDRTESKGKDAGVINQIERLGKAVAVHNEYLDQLFSIINPVLECDYPEAANEGQSEPPQSTELAGKIAVLRNRIEELTLKVRNRINRVGL